MERAIPVAGDGFCSRRSKMRSGYPGFRAADGRVINISELMNPLQTRHKNRRGKFRRKNLAMRHRAC
jgi:hypothetical protein